MTVLIMTSCSRPANSKVPLYTRPKVPSCTRVRQYNAVLEIASALAFSHGSVDWKSMTHIFLIMLNAISIYINHINYLDTSYIV